MRSVAKVPKNWPNEIIYLNRSFYGKSVHPAQLHEGPSPSEAFPTVKEPEGPSPKVHIQPISSQSHPAHGQSGLFAARNLSPDSFICFYLGFVHGPTETDPSSDYDLLLDRELQIGVNATRMGNEARFINDYRGIRPQGPNTEFRDCVTDVGSGVLERRIGVFVLSAGQKGGKRAKGIGKGEEIVVSYGKGFWSHRSAEKV
jgi:hypothetical protein